MTGIPLDKAELLAIFLETYVYGVFFTLFCITLSVLWRKRHEAQCSRYLIAVLSFMLVLATLHIVIDSVRIIEAFIFHHDSVLDGPTGYYAQISHPLHVTKTVVYVLMFLTGDMVVAWRCYVVYHKSLLIMIVPTLLFIASNISGYIVCWLFSRAGSRSTIFVTANGWVTSFFVLTLCMNTYCTGAIVCRIWSGIRSVDPHPQRNFIPLVIAFVESGSLYAFALLVLLTTYLSGSNGIYPVLDIVTPIVGIVFSLILIRLNVNVSDIIGNNTNAASWRVGQSTAQLFRRVSMRSVPVGIAVTTPQTAHIDHSKFSTFYSVDTSKEMGHELRVL